MNVLQLKRIRLLRLLLYVVASTKTDNRQQQKLIKELEITSIPEKNGNPIVNVANIQFILYRLFICVI